MPLIYISAYADVGTAVMALREGAYDFLPVFSPIY